MWILDIEASGLHPESYPIEIAIRNLHTREYFQALIKPMTGWTYWDANAEHNIHGISQEMLIDKGFDTAYVCEKIISLVGSKAVFYSDATDFDYFWLNRLFEESGYSCPDVQSVYALVHPSVRSELNTDLMQAYRKHRALDDVIQISNALVNYIE